MKLTKGQRFHMFSLPFLLCNFQVVIDNVMIFQSY